MFANPYKFIALIVGGFLIFQGNMTLADETTQSDEIRRLAYKNQVLESKLQRVENQIATLRRQSNPNMQSFNEVVAHQKLVTSLHPFLLSGHRLSVHLL